MVISTLSIVMALFLWKCLLKIKFKAMYYPSFNSIASFSSYIQIS